MLALGIESTCDETAAAVVEGPRKILSSVVKSQVAAHSVYGGVVPEIASRLHLHYLAGAIEEAMHRAGKKFRDLDLIAASTRPGLIGGLLVGATMGKSLAMLLNRDFVGVDHLLGHLLAPDLAAESGAEMQFPCIAGVFSGAHSNVYLGTAPLQWRLLAQTLDDAPGEAFDKAAQILGLPYPGGPSVQNFAGELPVDRFSLPSPLPAALKGNFSFSGLKTALLYQVRGMGGRAAVSQDSWPELAATFQSQVASALAQRMLRAAAEHDCIHLYIGGGVAANRKLREGLCAEAAARGWQAHFPPLSLCVDNAAMIARAGIVLREHGVSSPLDEDVSSRSELGTAAHA